jgi:Zn-dependent protease
MLGSPSPTPYDLRFRGLGIPVRVHWTFWLVTVLLSGMDSLLGTLIWVGCVFVSILVHEYGHGLMGRALGYDAHIVLFSMGGLCYSEGERQSPGQRLAVLFAGPGAGFVLLGLTLLAGSLAWGITPRQDLDILLLMLGFEPSNELAPALMRALANPTAFMIYDRLVQINLLWGILNLMPIWPLDGGQITRVLLTQANRREGARWTHIIAMITAALIAAYAATNSGHPLSFRTLFFGFLALVNFQQLQHIHETSRYGLDNDADWWRR